MSLLLENGKVLGQRYEIIQVLGQGGMGAVYLASDNRISGKKWAIKELWDYGDPATRQLVQEQFKTESAILAKLTHPNLPRVTDFFVYNNKEYLVMDFIEGETLENIMLRTKQPVDVDFALSVIRQLLDVLEYLHSLNPPVIFRDLKPANIMISPDGSLKLIDFGIARIFSAGKQKDTIVMGTPGYASPEQYGSSQSDARSDIYGLGATVYYILTNQDPADNPFHFDNPAQLNPKIPARLEKTILKCIQMDPDNRFPGVKELRTYLFDQQAIKTDQLSPDLAGTRAEQDPRKKMKILTPNPDKLDFGIVKRGDNKKQKFRLMGTADKLSVSADSPWIRIYPSLVNGTDEEIGATVYTRSLNHGGKYSGRILIKGEDLNLSIPLTVEIKAKHLSPLSYLVAVIFMILSLVPLLGYLGFFVNLIIFFSVPSGERKSLKVFFYVSLFVTLLYSAIGGVYFAIKYGLF